MGWLLVFTCVGYSFGSGCCALGRTSCLPPVASILRRRHSARRPAMSRGRLRTRRSRVRMGENSAGPVMCRRRTCWLPFDRFLRAMNCVALGAAIAVVVVVVVG